MRGLPPEYVAARSPSGQTSVRKVRKKSGQRKKSTQIGGSFTTNLGCAPRNIRNYNLRCEKADSDYNYKRCETVVGSHISTIIAVLVAYVLMELVPTYIVQTVDHQAWLSTSSTL